MVRVTSGGVLALVALAACAPVALLNGITPSGSFSKAKDISYGELPRQKLDIYKADKPRANAPVLVFIHGGSWSEGNKDIYKFLAQGFTVEGFDVVVPNYRLYPEARYPMMIEDTAKAIGFAAKQYPDRRLVVMGHSAGAYNMLMTVLDKSYLANENVDLCGRIAGVVSLSGPTGIVALKKEPYITIFPDRFTGTDAPLNNVTGPTPPLFFGHGSKDTTVYPQNSQDLAKKIIARGGQAEVKIYEGMDHTGAVRVMSKFFDGKADLKADVIRFIDGLPKTGGDYCQ